MLPAVTLIKLGVSIASIAIPAIMTRKEKKDKTKRLLEDRLYCGFNSNEYTEQEVKELCKEHGIDYPPQPLRKLS
jgi:hypothetical protein